MFQALLTFAILVCSAVQEKCELGVGFKDLQTGSFQLLESLQNNSRIDYTANVQKFKVSRKIQLSASVVYLDNYLNDKQLYFKIFTTTYADDMNKFTISLTMSPFSSWTRAHINYLATSSENLGAGFFSALNGEVQFLRQDAENKFQQFSITQSIKMSEPLRKSRNLYGQIFISGIKSSNIQLNLKITDQVFVNGSLVTLIKITKGQLYGLEILDFTYLIYASDQVFNIQLFTDLNEGLNKTLGCTLNANNQFLGFYFGFGGVNGTELSALLEEKRRRLLFISPNPLTLEVFISGFQIKGLKLSNAIQIGCPEGSRLVTNDNGQRQCQSVLSEPLIIPNCSTFQILNSLTNQCQCATQNFNQQNECIGCSGQFQVWDNIEKTCQCIQGANLVRGKCRFCSQNAVYINDEKTCRCNGGYVGNGVICRESVVSSLVSSTIFPNLRIVFEESSGL